ncbi:MAG: hypothetical protein ACTSVY_08565 [Candidatus Helarchaeota archaeon]
MSININWSNRDYLQYLFFIFGISGIIHYFLILQVELLLPINSIFVLLLVPIGVNLVNSSSIALLVEIILHWRNKRIYEKRFQKDIKEFSFKKAVIIAFSVVNGVFLSFYFAFSIVFYDPTILLIIPTFGKFIIVELLGSLLINVIILFIDHFQHRSKKKK